MRKRSIRAVLLLCAAATAAAACTGTTSNDDPPGEARTSTAAEHGIAPGIPEDLRPAAEAFARYRQIDACALHDPGAAQEASGDGSKSDRIMPSQDGFNSCTQWLAKSEFQSTWTVYLTVAAEFPAGRRNSAAPERIGGVEVFVQEEGQPLPACKIIRPLDDTFAIVLDAKPDDRDNVPRPPCDFARDYVDKMAERWKNPPGRDASRTTPDLRLALRDPCEAVAAVSEGMGQGAKITPYDVYECSIQPGRPAAGDKATVPGVVAVVFGLDVDPVDLTSTPTGKYTAGELAGFKVVSGTVAGMCRNHAVWDAGTQVIEDNRDDDEVPALQVVRIDTPSADCGAGRHLVEKILTKVGKS